MKTNIAYELNENGTETGVISSDTMEQWGNIEDACNVDGRERLFYFDEDGDCIGFEFGE